MMFDSHAHLDDEKYDSDREKIIKSLKDAGVSAVINVGSDLASSVFSVELADRYDFIHATAGIHPLDASNYNIDKISELKKLAQSGKKIVAIGEIGLDYYHPDYDKNKQRGLFMSQLELASELKLPVVLHCRNAFDDLIPIIEQYQNLKIVFHCYSGDWNLAQALLSKGYYLSFTGNLTYPKSLNLVEVVKNMPLNKLLVETDCPYLSPNPFRGKRNEPAHVKYIIQKVSEIRNCSFTDIERITWNNTCRFFNLQITNKDTND